MLKSSSLCLYSSNLGTFWLQKVPKFELYKHNDEHFNIYYGIFYELWTFTDFDQLCKLEKRGDEIKKNLLWNAHHYAYTVQIWALSGLK
jgi:hypothetical protein